MSEVLAIEDGSVDGHSDDDCVVAVDDDGYGALTPQKEDEPARPSQRSMASDSAKAKEEIASRIELLRTERVVASVCVCMCVSASSA